LAVILLKSFPARAWQLTHGSFYNSDRVSLKLDPHWLVRQDEKGRDWIQRPEAFSSVADAIDVILIRESKQCPAAETEMQDTYNKILTNQNTRRDRPLPPIIHLVTSPEVVDCAVLSGDGGLMECFLPKDGTSVHLDISSFKGASAKQEALTMMKSIRITKSCLPVAQ
jgi:hypothetical protein